MKFDYPLVLLLIPLGLGLLWWLTGRRRTGHWPWYASFIIRSLIIILLISLLAGIKFRMKNPDRCRLYLVDNSGSIFLNPVAVSDAIQKDVQRLKPTDRAGVIVFGGNAALEIAPTSPAQFPDAKQFNSTVEPANTNLVKALRLALEIFPPDYQKEIILLSDGNETAERATDLVPLLRNQGIIVDTLPIGPGELSDVRIEEFSLPESVAENEPLAGFITIASTINTKINLYLSSNGQPVKQLNNLAVNTGNPTRFLIELPPLDRSLSEYEARVIAPGINELCPQNNIAQKIVVRKGKPAVLYMSSVDKAIGDFLRNSQDFSFDSRNTTENISLYDMVIIDDIPHEQLTDIDLTRLKDFVENGGGLLLTGGKSSYALGGYVKSPLEEIAPVWFSPRENIGLVVILDRSGSMDEMVTPEQNKWAIAQQSLAEAIKLLNPDDRLEIIVFNDRFETVYPFGAPPEFAGLKKTFSRIQPNGSTAILPPIQRQAVIDLNKMQTTRKHIIIITDGTSTTGETIADARPVAGILKNAGITLSAIATGSKVDEEFLRLISTNTGGGFYPVKDLTKLSDFLKTDLAYYKELYREKDKLKAVIKSTEGMFKAIPSELPPLKGYNRTALKEKGKLVAALPDDDPLIAEGQYGLGRMIIFTSSFDTNWAGEWQTWPYLGQFITQILRWITPARAGKKKDWDIKTTIINNRDIKIRMRSLTDENYLTIAAEIDRSNEPTNYRFTQTAPGEYECTISNLDIGTYHISLFKIPDNSFVNKVLIEKLPVVIPYAAEWKKFGADAGYLRNLAELTGGRLLKNLEENDESIGIESSQVLSYQTPLGIILLVVLALFILDLVVNSPLVGRYKFFK